ncbi:hypothetical protein LguiA_014769 [Lonicera macranthoides]
MHVVIRVTNFEFFEKALLDGFRVLPNSLYVTILASNYYTLRDGGRLNSTAYVDCNDEGVEFQEINMILLMKMQANTSCKDALLSPHFIPHPSTNDALNVARHSLMKKHWVTRYVMQNPQSYVNSNIAGFVNLLEIAKAADPQSSIVWASSSSVYSLNTQNPFSESHRTDQPASLYAATKMLTFLIKIFTIDVNIFQL